MRNLNLHTSQIHKDKIFHKVGIAYLFTQMDRLGVSPNYITATGKLFGLLSVYYLFENPILFAIFYIAHQIIDGFDGSYARSTGKESESGRRFDHLGDLVIHSLLILKATLYFPELSIAYLALVVYIGEYLVLNKLRLGDRKFPTSIFAIFYIFGFYQIGLTVQILYQLISLPIFLFFQRKRSAP